MVSTRQLAELVDHAAARGAKLVLVGDHRQLPELEAGGAFRGLTTRLPAIELHENRRQVDGWERDALALLRDGSVELALQRYQDRGRVVVRDDAAELRRQLVTDWWAARDPDRAVMIAYRRVDVLDLNGRARELMRAAGALGVTELRLPGGSFAVGDRVLLRRNDLRLGVSNGDRGTILAVDPAARALDVDVGGRRVLLGSAYLERATRNGSSLAHGYAITGHSAQGMTCRKTFVLALGPVSREWGYTALSRGSEANRLYAVAGESDERSEYAPTEARPVDPHQSLVAAFSRSAAQTLASDVAREAPPQRELVPPSARAR